MRLEDSYKLLNNIQWGSETEISRGSLDIILEFIESVMKTKNAFTNYYMTTSSGFNFIFIDIFYSS